jgi:hypothetical protein
MAAIFPQSERGVQDALEMRVAHADVVHVLDGVLLGRPRRWDVDQ